MPWVKIGRYRFDLDDVVLVTDVVGREKGEQGDPPERGGGVTVTLATTLTFDLVGRDADIFTAAFDEHVAGREINGRPPPLVYGGQVSYPSADRVFPAKADG